MRNTKLLKNWDKVKIWVEKTGDFEYWWGWYKFITTAIFKNWVFVDWNEIYWSSVYKFKIIPLN